MTPTSAVPSPSLQATAEPAFLPRLMPPLRFVAAGAIAALELLTFAALGHPWLPTGQIATGPIAFFAALLFFGRHQLRDTSALSSPLNLRFVAAHIAAFFSAIALQLALLHTASTSTSLIACWIAAILATFATMLCALVPPRTFAALGRSLGMAWIYASICGTLIVFARRIELILWNAPDSTAGAFLANLAFHTARFALGLFYPTVIADPITRTLGTEAFQVRVAGACSGIEGLSLTLVFLAAWMFVERKHLRLARAALLVPAALALMWLLNIARLTALIAIGDHGYPELALTGFHTEAGWIAFTAVTLAILLTASRTPWFQRTPNVAAISVAHAPNFALLYLAPFLSVLAASLITGALATSAFEPLYPLRFLACAIVLFALRKYFTLPRSLDRTSIFLATAFGLAIGVAWIFAARASDATLANSLAELSPAARYSWLLFRTLAAVITVPIAEELAFRGFLARLLTRPSAPQTVAFSRIRLPAIALSSLAFGLMHGHLWPVATLTGIGFAYLTRRANSLVPAIVAHAAANLALAVFALTTHNYSVW